LSYRFSISNARLCGAVRFSSKSASAINPNDVGNVAGAFQAELPRVPGRDFAGVVVEGGGDEWNGKEVWGKRGRIGSEER
jgi:NADPH:quinone reductase-like Zn-dependent oxidoreductase